MADKYDELESLLFDWECETLDDEGVETVRAPLRGDAELRTYYAQRQVISATLFQESGRTIGLEEDEVVSSETLSESVKRPATSTGQMLNRWRLRPLLAAAATLLVAVIATRWGYLETKGFKTTVEVSKNETQPDASGIVALGDVPVAEATSSGLALVTRMVEVDWADGQSPIEVGEALLPGRLAIDSGLVQVEFFCGATVVVEGPAELDLKSSTLARVVNGKLRAQVPPAARGFALEVDGMKVVDLGTEFALGVASGRADVQVYDGEVELHSSSGGTAERLIAGQAIERARGGQIKRVELTPGRFVNIDAMESEAVSQRAERFQRWKEWSNAVRVDSRLLAYYAFDQHDGGSRRLQCSGTETTSVSDVTELDGAIVGAQRVTGRWAQKGGLEFKRPGDRVRVQIPGEFGSLTLACWARIDSLDRRFNSLFLTDNYDKGEPHWQILESGQLYFSVRPNDQGMGGPHDQKILSPPFWKPSLSGKWLHFAVTYDVQAKLATHFLDGRVIHQESITDQQLVSATRIGAATIGNWSLPTQPNESFAVRNLNGRIDEFVMFSDALSTEEIREIYENGKP